MEVLEKNRPKAPVIVIIVSVVMLLLGLKSLWDEILLLRDLILAKNDFIMYSWLAPLYSFKFFLPLWLIVVSFGISHMRRWGLYVFIFASLLSNALALVLYVFFDIINSIGTFSILMYVIAIGRTNTGIA